MGTGALLSVDDDRVVFVIGLEPDGGSRRTSASRGSSRGKIAPIVNVAGSCVGISVG